jgi:myo-inositol-1(or 4)-monophosphatase
MSDLAALLPIAHAAVDAAADLARTSPPGILTPKGDRDYASEVDFAIERTVRDFLDRQTPGIAFVGEEENASASEKAEWWTLDPIDGTVNFAGRYAPMVQSLRRRRSDLA